MKKPNDSKTPSENKRGTPSSQSAPPRNSNVPSPTVSSDTVNRLINHFKKDRAVSR